jgi:hypothetical protein
MPDPITAPGPFRLYAERAEGAFRRRYLGTFPTLAAAAAEVKRRETWWENEAVGYDAVADDAAGGQWLYSDVWESV